MFQSGASVAAHLRPHDDASLADDQVQPNGVDLTLDAVFEPTEPGRIDTDGKRVGDRRRIDPDADEDGELLYWLEPGGYVVRYGEVIAVPDGHVGFVLPRSTLLRNGCTLETAVWDAGYEGRGEGLLQVHHPIEIRPGARIGQFVLAAADHEEQYDGDYQGENTEREDSVD
ncbi:deoxyuridine 5'-triphosphate nucleotidohydrolase [Halobaculum sp. MBLA0143]|uniref:deoxyuridine 5'-triphosphate nucleotidohydrolase n=1 Tax=Halobaculum sp. MBLA0143 TaxID=3079933 RepID=UPI003524EE30